MAPPLLLPALALLSLSALAGCSCGSPTIGPLDSGDSAPEEDLSEHVYDPDHVLRVEIDIEEAYWEALRTQTRDAWDLLSGEDCLDEPFGSPFTYFPATVAIDGQVFPNVGVRKKGFLGSLSTVKPALKVDLSEYGEEALFSGVERLTLNNAVSDPAYLRQCLGYGFYRDAGMPASRCNYATVAVNGQSLGVFVNVEPIKTAFLGRHFEDDQGNLYEGTLSDFRQGWSGTFEKKENEEEDDWSDIEAMVAALQAEDDQLLTALEPVLDLDAFYTHWAAEVISDHIDGYAWNTNNYYLYADSADGGRFHFIPWGIDALLYDDEDEGVPASVYAYGYLANRLFAIEEGRAAYHVALQQLLASAWDEALFNERMDRDKALVLAELSAEEGEAVGEAIEVLRARMEGRRPAIEAALAQGEEWELGLRDNWCFTPLGELTAEFDTTWGSLTFFDAFTYGEASMSFTWDDELFEIDSAGTVAGESHEDPVLYVAAWLSPTEAVIAYFTAPESYFVPGSFELDLGTAVGAMFYYDATTMEDFEFMSYVLGSVTLEQAGTDSGDAITGSMTGELLSFGW